MDSLELDDGVTQITIHPLSLSINETNQAYTLKIPESDVDYTMIADSFQGGSIVYKTYEELSFDTATSIDIVVDNIITYTTIITSVTRDIYNKEWSYNLTAMEKSW